MTTTPKPSVDEALAEFRQAFVIAVGDKSPFAKTALERFDSAIRSLSVDAARPTTEASELLSRAARQLSRWHEKYGAWQPDWLPPAGDVEIQEDIDAYRARHESRAAKLERRGIPFFVVKASEPYARQVVELIRTHEGDKWTADDEAWAESVLPAAQPASEPMWFAVDTPGADFDVTFFKTMAEVRDFSSGDEYKVTPLYAAPVAQPQAEPDEWDEGENAARHILAVMLDGETDEFNAWYKPEQWLGMHRAVAGFLKARAHPPVQPTEPRLSDILERLELDGHRDAADDLRRWFGDPRDIKAAASATSAPADPGEA